MRRREFITLIGGTVVACPLAGRAQQPAMPVIGFLSIESLETSHDQVTAFRRGLNETGLSEGHNVAIEYRWAEGQYDRLPQLAADLVHRQVAVIAATGAGPSAAAANAATATIPIVFATGADPVQEGLVASLNQPGGNITGVYVFTSVVEGKRLGLLREMVPTATLIAVLLNPANTGSDSKLNDIQEAARSVGQPIHILNASPPSRQRHRSLLSLVAAVTQSGHQTQEAARLLGLQLVLLQATGEREIDEAVASLIQQGAAALIVSGDAILQRAGAIPG